MLRQRGGGALGLWASTVALQERGCHDDRDQEGDGAGVQRDACSGRGGGVGRTAVGVCGHGGGVGVGGGVPPRCGVCAVLGDHLLKEEEEEEDGGMKRVPNYSVTKLLLIFFFFVAGVKINTVMINTGCSTYSAGLKLNEAFRNHG